MEGTRSAQRLWVWGIDALDSQRDTIWSHLSIKAFRRWAATLCSIQASARQRPQLSAHVGVRDRLTSTAEHAFSMRIRHVKLIYEATVGLAAQIESPFFPPDSPPQSSHPIRFPYHQRAAHLGSLRAEYAIMQGQNDDLSSAKGLGASADRRGTNFDNSRQVNDTYNTTHDNSYNDHSSHHIGDTHSKSADYAPAPRVTRLLTLLTNRYNEYLWRGRQELDP